MSATGRVHVVIYTRTDYWDMYNQNWNTSGTDFPLVDSVKHADNVSKSEYMTQIQPYMIYTGKDKK